MKIFISADIEGVACICDRSEVDSTQPGSYEPFRRQMAVEVRAACDGAFAAGAQSILVKDAHGTGRNLQPHELEAPPGRELELIRGWSGHPFCMVQGIDASFAKVVFVGFHSAAGSAGNPLAHTISSRTFSRVELNGVSLSEFRLHALVAATIGIPTCFVSGDEALCEEARRSINGIRTVATMAGCGQSVRSITSSEAARRIRAAVKEAVGAPAPPQMQIPSEFSLILTFVRPPAAYANSFFPGVRQISDTQLLLESSRFFDVLTFLQFAVR